MRITLFSAATLAVLTSIACSDAPKAGSSKRDDDVDGGGGTSGGPSDPVIPSKISKTGTVALKLTADKGAASDDIVSFGLPFPQGVFNDAKQITVLDKDDKPVDIATKVLAKWPGDQSIRSVLVAFKATLAQGASEDWKVEYGKAPKGGDAGALAANPDGPVIATLTADHYAASLVSGILMTKEKDKKFAQYEAEIDRGDTAFDLSTMALQCNGGPEHRTYYDGIHARYQRGLRSGDPAHLRAAHNEAIWYRANELEWVGSGKKVAITKCEAVEAAKAFDPNPAPTWGPDVRPLDWSTIRMMSGQGSLDDYLITGDPESKEMLAGFGEAYIQNLPLLEERTLELTERNLGWPIMGVVSYYAIDQSDRVRQAAEGLVKRAYAWQKRGTSGALEHDMNKPDPNECYGGDEDPAAAPKGASPFMTSLVVDGIMDWWVLTNDAAVKPFMEKLATWYQRDALTGDKKSFQYIWGCKKYEFDPSKPGGDPDGFTSPELNILMSHVFGATYAVTKDKKWIEFGDSMAEVAIEYMYVGGPKAWNQQARSFGKYLGYRELSGAAP